MGAHVEPPRGGGGDFFAQARNTGTPDGIGFVDYEVDPCTTRFGSGADESMVEIGLLYAGRMRVRHGKNQTSVLHAGDGPVLFDAARPLIIQTPRCAGAHLYVPRAAVELALGDDAVPRGSALRPLPSDPVAAQLVQCLRSLHGESSQDAAQVVATLHTAHALALVALANTRDAGHRWPGELEAALYAAACHQLVQHIANPRVTVDEVAATLQCSRAQLYRLFAARGQSVAGYLRELRMQRAATWLTTRPELAIGVISDGCGYSDLVSFDKAFRRRFGMAPRDWRASHARDTGAPG